jgi:transcription antitermination factor NusG
MPALYPEKYGKIYWFAVYTTSRHEKRVAWHLQQRGIEHCLPLYRTQHRWKDGRQAMLELPLFPGYVFVRIGAEQRVGVLGIPGIVSIVGTSAHPAPLPDFEVEALRKGLDPMRAEPHPFISAGERVRIKTGALAGIEGIVVRKKSRYRVVLTLHLLMQSIAIEVEAEDVAPVDTSFPLTLQATDKQMEKRACLDHFYCLDPDESTQVIVAGGIGHSDAY